MDMGTDNWVRCNFQGCYHCCLETEMILTEADIISIEKLGYFKNSFLIPLTGSDGYYQLKNIESKIGIKCYFLTDKGKCKLYRGNNDSRPQGCRIYPLIIDLNENSIVIDIDCRETEWFKEQKYLKSQTKSVTTLVGTLLDENEKRKS